MRTPTWRPLTGVYDTANGYLALAMSHLPTLGKLLDLSALQDFPIRLTDFAVATRSSKSSRSE